MGKRAFEFYTKNGADAVYCFADTFKGGTEYCGKPVISFEEFVKIHSGYDVVICIYDLFGLVHDFDIAGVHKFTVWDDSLTIPDTQKNVQYFEHLRSIDKQDSRQKILYGAGYYGEQAFYCYGRERVYAFADMSKAGTEYLGKPVLHPSELAGLFEKYDIIVCVKEYKSVVEYLKKLPARDFRLFIHFDDVRADNPSVRFMLKNTVDDPEVIDELSKLDFIENPDLINGYRDKYTVLARRFDGIKPEEERYCGRFIEENKRYGYLGGMMRYADRELRYYEAPSVCHGYYLTEVPTPLYWNNLIEAGEVNVREIYKSSKDCLCFLVGPYLHYMESFYDEAQLAVAKKKLGRNLTVFPVHSITATTVKYDAKEFVNKALKEAKNFDSLSVCAFSLDYDTETIRLFRANGAKIVTAGYVSDPSFAKRLKTILLLSDAVLTNGVGSHINHALSLNRPVKAVSQQVTTHSVGDNNGELDKVYGANKLNLQTVLETGGYKITREQLDAYEPSTGFTKIKTKEEMGAIFDLSKRIIENCDYKRSRYIDSLRQTYRDLQRAASPEEKIQFSLMKDALPEDYDEYLRGLGI